MLGVLNLPTCTLKSRFSAENKIMAAFVGVLPSINFNFDKASMGSDGKVNRLYHPTSPTLRAPSP